MKIDLKRLLGFAFCFLWLLVARAESAEIPHDKISDLQEELAEATTKRGSTTSKRRDYKNIARDADSLVRRYDEASNRFEVYAIKLKSLKQLFTIDDSRRNRDALFEACEELAQAPDEYSDIRLEADLLLSEAELSAKNADLQERTQALAAMVQKYKDTPGEAKCLMIATRIAPKLEAFELEQKALNALQQRFPAAPGVIGFRRAQSNAALLDVGFSGNFKRKGGTLLSFPMDRIGHNSLFYFWSKETPGLEQLFQDVKAQQGKFPGQFKVFSFNLDELPDAGESILRENGLDWTALHLSGGKESSTFEAYAQQVPAALWVNAQGRALVTNGLMFKDKLPLIPPATEDDSKRPQSIANAPLLEDCQDTKRYLAQLQSLFIGDFLVHAIDPNPGNFGKQTLDAIKSCFVPSPIRYRHKPEHVLKNYKKADKLCREAAANHPNAPDLWRINNYRIIALLGMWNLETNPAHLQTAMEIANSTLEAKIPPEAQVIPFFCLAKDKIRRGDATPESIPAFVLQGVDPKEASGLALAAATQVALDANAQESFAKYRKILLEKHWQDSALWPMTNFLRDRHHRYRFFRATHSRYGFNRAERHTVGRNVAALDEPADTSRIFEALLTTLEGEEFQLPQASEGKLSLIAFMDVTLDEKAGKNQDSFMKKFTSIQEQNDDVNVMAAFLSQDAEQVAKYVESREWTCPVYMVPGGLNNRLLVRYGILSADVMPNVFLLRPDGSISWSISGITYPVQGSGMAARVMNAIDANLAVCQMEIAKAALDQGKYEDALNLFLKGAREKVRGDYWGTFRYHGRTKAHIALKNWEAALEDIDLAIEAHKNFSHGKQHRSSTLAKLQFTRADILDQLGRKEEAAEMRKVATEPTQPHNRSPYGLYGEGLETFRLNPLQ